MTAMRLQGNWYNEFGSMMILKVNGRQVSGIYHTTVGSGEGGYELVGRTDTDQDQDRQNVGFVVSWENDLFGSSDSVTAWSGQLQRIDDQEVITTTWLLTMETSPGSNWKSTVVGKDVFTRVRPTADKVASAQNLGGTSHPPKATR